MRTARPGRPAPFDVAIHGGCVIDGSGGPARHVDVGIRGGRIDRMGTVPEGAALEIDAVGLVVAPGFVDVHTHFDGVTRMPRAENYLRMGVTTVVTGNCGFSAPSVPAFLSRLARRPVSTNVASLVGHSAVRLAGMPSPYDRRPGPREMDAMRRLVRRAMAGGAVGFSTGLIYTPGVFGDTDEIVTLAREAAEAGGIYTSHMRNESTGILEALEEVRQVAAGAKMPAHVSHIKLSGNAAWGRAQEVLAFIDGARRGGLDVTQDMYAYTASSTGLNAVLPADLREGGPAALALRLEDPRAVARAVGHMRDDLERHGRDDFAYVFISACPHVPEVVGMTVPEAATVLYGSSDVERQMEAIMAIESRGRAAAVYHGICEDDLQVFLRHPNTMIGSDGGPHRPGPDAPHPRSYGNNARVLGRYVRELGVLGLEDAVRRMTWLPASTFGLSGRGLLCEGFAADVTVFDPARVTDHAAFGDPHHCATGFVWVLVNGVPSVRRDAHTGARAGQPVRRGRS